MDLSIRDVRTGEKVIIHKTRKDACKTYTVIVLVEIPVEPGWAIPHFTQYVPGGQIHNEYLCEYPDHSISWVNGKYIQ